MKTLLRVCILVVCILCADWATAQEAGQQPDIAHLIPQRADPFITRGADGTYYFIATVPSYDRIEIRQSKTLDGLKDAEAVVVWRKHREGIMGNHIWAPELHQIDGTWYIYFAAGSAEEKWKIRKYVLSNAMKNPTEGSWKEEGEMESRRNDFSLDATTFMHKGQRYMIWVDRASDSVVNTGLYIAKMISPTKLDDRQVVISQPEYEWEMRGHKVNEGPAVLVRNGKVFLTFSASATDASYCIGLLWADEEADLLNPNSWHKLREPVFFTNEKLRRFGPGHNSFTTSEDGTKDIMVYHARDYKDIDGEPLYDPNRHTHVRELKWTKEGMPDFGQEYSDKDFSSNPNNFSNYLFAYFSSNSPDGEQVRYAVSKDGVNYRALNNGEPILASDSIALKKGIRDPHILRGEDGETFYMVLTDMRSSEGWQSNDGIVLMKSKDLINWEHSRIDFPSRFPNLKGFDRENLHAVWAPQTIWDAKKKQYMIYYSIGRHDWEYPVGNRSQPYFKIFYSYANKDFTDITEPKLLFDFGSAAIDGDIVYDKKNKQFVLFFKDEGLSTVNNGFKTKNGIMRATSRKLKGPYKTEYKHLQKTDAIVEGSSVFPIIDSDKYMLMYDCYTEGYYQFCISDDLTNFEFVKNTDTKGNFTPRHGSVIQITNGELDRLERLLK